MKASRVDLGVEQGTTFRRVVRFYHDKERTQPMDLTGFAAAAWATNGTFRLVFAVAIDADTAAGKISMSLSPSQTLGILTGTYDWDMLLRDAEGNVRKAIKGTLTVYPTETELPNA